MKQLVFAALAAVAFAAATVPGAPVQAADYSNWTEDVLKQNCEFQAERARTRNSSKDYHTWGVVGSEFRQVHGRRTPYCEANAICRRSGFFGTAREAEGQFYTSKPGDPWYRPGDPVDTWFNERTWAHVAATEDLRCCNDGNLRAQTPNC